MAHAYANRSTMHNDVVVHLIKKLIVNPMLVGDEKSLHLSKYIGTFWNEYDDFVNMRGCFSHKYMWDTAWGDNVKAYRWHQRYSLQETKVLGKLACLVLSKILGIGTAEQNWKQVKYIKSGLRRHTDTDKVKKQAALWTVPAGKGSCETVKAIFCRQVVGREQFQIVEDGRVLQGYVAITR